MGMWGIFLATKKYFDNSISRYFRFLSTQQHGQECYLIRCPDALFFARGYIGSRDRFGGATPPPPPPKGRGVTKKRKVTNFRRRKFRKIVIFSTTNARFHDFGEFLAKSDPIRQDRKVTKPSVTHPTNRSLIGRQKSDIPPNESIFI